MSYFYLNPNAKKEKTNMWIDFYQMKFSKEN